MMGYEKETAPEKFACATFDGAIRSPLPNKQSCGQDTVKYLKAQDEKYGRKKALRNSSQTRRGFFSLEGMPQGQSQRLRAAWKSAFSTAR